MSKVSSNNLIPLFVIIGGSVLLLISFGLRHSFGLYLLPISNYLNTGREVFSFGAALQVLMIGIGLLIIMRYRPRGILPEKIIKQ